MQNLCRLDGFLRDDERRENCGNPFIFTDEFEIVSKLFEKTIMSDLSGKTLIVFISTSSTADKMARSLTFMADEFLIEPPSINEIVNITNGSIWVNLFTTSE